MALERAFADGEIPVDKGMFVELEDFAQTAAARARTVGRIEREHLRLDFVEPDLVLVAIVFFGIDAIVAAVGKIYVHETVPGRRAVSTESATRVAAFVVHHETVDDDVHVAFFILFQFRDGIEVVKFAVDADTREPSARIVANRSCCVPFSRAPAATG